MGDVKLDEIEARAAAATPGAWWQGDTEDEERGDADCVYVGRERLAGPFDWESDAAFVAHARADVPALCAIVREAVELRRKWLAPVGTVSDNEYGAASDAFWRRIDAVAGLNGARGHR